MTVVFIRERTICPISTFIGIVIIRSTRRFRGGLDTRVSTIKVSLGNIPTPYDGSDKINNAYHLNYRYYHYKRSSFCKLIHYARTEHLEHNERYTNKYKRFFEKYRKFTKKLFIPFIVFNLKRKS